MWGVRILTGPQKGQFFHLSKGFNRIGRSASCENNSPELSNI